MVRKNKTKTTRSTTEVTEFFYALFADLVFSGEYL